MKVLVFSHYWSPQNGVPQRRWQWLTNILVAAGIEVEAIVPKIGSVDGVRRREFFLTLFGVRHPGKVGERGAFGERIIRVASVPSTSSLAHRAINQGFVAFSSLLTACFLYRVRGAGKPDVIVGTVPALPSAAAAFLTSKLLRVPYVLDLRDAWPDLLHESGKWNESVRQESLVERLLKKGPLLLVKAVTQRMLEIAIRNADKVMVTSEWLQNDLVQKGLMGNGRNPNRIYTVRNVFPREVDYLRSSFESKKKGELNVLYAGTIGRAQGLENVLEAAKIAHAEGVAINLRFIGAGDAKPKLRERARQLGVRATFESRVRASGMGEPYSWADTVLVHLADWEPLERTVPSKTYELMEGRVYICGVVHGETAELIRSTGAGSVVPPANPKKLAEEWIRLVRHNDTLEPSKRARIWVQEERNNSAEPTVLEIFNKVGTDDAA